MTVAKQLKKCPKCGSSLRTIWTNGRKLMQECRDEEFDSCDWKGSPYTPPKRPIRTVKTIPTDQGGWEYEGFDQYGHTFVVSQGFSSEKACREAAKRELLHMSKVPEYGKCVAVVWPPRTKVHGKLVRA
jgi:hypothetical protein